MEIWVKVLIPVGWALLVAALLLSALQRMP